MEGFHPMKRTRSTLAAVTASLLSTAVTAGEEQYDDGQLRFVVSALDPDRGGTVLCGLYDEQDGWLSDHPFRYDKQRVSGATAVCIFDRVPPGTYAVAAMHDEDGDEQMDTNVFGFPIEGHCASRDAHEAGFGAPDWRDAAFRYDGRAGYLASRMSY
jgi:uncharacterized protein (DUF2141 family)